MLLTDENKVYNSIVKEVMYSAFYHFSKMHLQKYIDEFSFRFNKSSCKIDKMDKIGLLIVKSHCWQKTNLIKD